MVIFHVIVSFTRVWKEGSPESPPFLLLPQDTLESHLGMFVCWQLLVFREVPGAPG
ncbi:hypothetical protein STEG23_026246, partial [Scotinomys teguina]